MISDKLTLSGADIAQAGRTSVTSAVERTRDSNVQKTGAAGRRDEVELSGLTGKISKAMDADASQRASRVAELTSAVQSGAYKVDSAAVAGAILDESLTSHAAGE
jgi:flagellar biosynthesis anti-sigma factor FlgM